MTEAMNIRHSAVQFTDGEDGSRCGCQPLDESRHEKKRNLTMKYGQKQRDTVRKRINVENWLDSELQRLYNITSPDETYPCDPDLDELLEIKSEEERRRSIMELVKQCKQADAVIQAFIEELLKKIKTLI